MALSVSRSALNQFYDSPRLILCEHSVYEVFANAAKSQATVVRYRGNTIGDGGRRQGPSIELSAIGLPTALEMIVAPVGCRTAKELVALVRASGFPRPVPLIEVGTHKNAAVALAAAYHAEIERGLVAHNAQRTEREREVVVLRRNVEVQTFKNNHLLNFLDMLGYASQELSIEQAVDHSAGFLDLPVVQKLPVLLSGVAGISVYAAPSEGSQKLALRFEIAGSAVGDRMVDLSETGGWHDIFFPAGFADNTQDAVLKIEPLLGQPRLLASPRDGAVQGKRHAALRIWRHADARIQPLQTTAYLPIGRPASISGNVLHEAAILRASGLPSIEQLISPLDDCLVQTHPVPNQIANYVVRDLPIGNVSAVTADVCLDHPQASPVKFAMFLTPMADEEIMYAALGKAIDSGRAESKSRLATVLLTGQQTGALTVSTEGLDRDQRYCLVLAAKSTTRATGYAWAKWRKVGIQTEGTPFRQTYRCANFSALTSQIQHADGPVVEEELNRQLRLRELGMNEVDLFLQIHPAQDRAVGARLHSFAPKGMQRLWLDISVDHPEASPTEFGVLLSESAIQPPFDAYYRDNGIAALADDTVFRLGNGSLLKKKLLRPMERAWLDLDLLEPLAQTSHVYLFVNVRSGSPAFGWCRWHRLAMTIFAEASV